MADEHEVTIARQRLLARLTEIDGTQPYWFTSPEVIDGPPFLREFREPGVLFVWALNWQITSHKPHGGWQLYQPFTIAGIIESGPTADPESANPYTMRERLLADVQTVLGKDMTLGGAPCLGMEYGACSWGAQESDKEQNIMTEGRFDLELLIQINNAGVGAIP